MDKFNIEAAYALFPTVEYMADSPNGRRLGPVLRVTFKLDFVDEFYSFVIQMIGL